MKTSALSNLFMIYGQSFPNLFKLMDYLLTLPASSVEAEWDFDG